jgi:hypothetical protein
MASAGKKGPKLGTGFLPKMSKNKSKKGFSKKGPAAFQAGGGIEPGEGGLLGEEFSREAVSGRMQWAW